MLFLSDLSIIIPTYNRQEYVLRNMCYWSNYDLTVHVLDGTKTPIPSNKLTKLGAKINYHHMPIPLMERLYKSIELVSTKYSMMMGDDEFYIPSALESCIILLDKDEEYISCIGAAISFKVENSKVTSNVKYPCLKNSALMQNIPVDRATYHMKNYCPSIVYSVMRTDAWKKSMRALSYNNYEVYVMSIGELQFEIAGSYLGKTAVINELMWLRSSENEPNRSHHNGTAMPIHQWWNEPSNELIRDEIVQTIVQSISDKQYDHSSVTDDINRAFIAYLDVGKKNKTIKQKIISILPGNVLRAIKFILHNIFKIKRGSLLSMHDVVVRLNNNGINVNEDELDSIVSLISDFHSCK